MPPKGKQKKTATKKIYHKEVSGHLHRRWVDKIELQCLQERATFENDTAKLDRLQTDNDAAHKMIESLERELSQHNQTLQRRRTEKQRLAQRVEQLQKATDADAAELEGLFDQFKTGDHDMAMNACDGLQKEIDAFAGLEDALEKRFSDKQAELTRLDEEYQSLQEHLEELQGDLEDVKGERDKLEVRRDALQAELADAITAFDEKSSELRNAGSSLKKLEDRVAELQNWYDDAAGKLKVLDVQHRNLQEAHGKLQTDCTTLRSERDENERVREETARRCDELATSVEGLKAENSGLAATLKAAQAANSNQGSDLNELNRKLEAAVGKHAQQRERTKDASRKESVMRAELAVMRQQRDQAAIRYATRTADEITRLKLELESQKTRNAELVAAQPSKVKAEVGRAETALKNRLEKEFDDKLRDALEKQKEQLEVSHRSNLEKAEKAVKQKTKDSLKTKHADRLARKVRAAEEKVKKDEQAAHEATLNSSVKNAEAEVERKLNAAHELDVASKVFEAENKLRVTLNAAHANELKSEISKAEQAREKTLNAGFKDKLNRELTELGRKRDNELKEVNRKAGEDRQRLLRQIEEHRTEAEGWQNTTSDYVHATYSAIGKLSDALYIQHAGGEIQREDGTWDRFEAVFDALSDEISLMRSQRNGLTSAVQMETAASDKLAIELNATKQQVESYEAVLSELLSIKVDDDT